MDAFSKLTINTSCSLLSEDEKVRYATMQAMEAKGAGKKGNSESSGGKDCCVS